jgi:hypothetical protein
MNKMSVQNIGRGLLYSIWTGGAFVLSSVVLIGLPIHYFASDSFYNWLQTPVGSLALAIAIYVLAAVIAVLIPFVVRHVSQETALKELGLSKWLNLRMAGRAVVVWVMYFFTTAFVSAFLSIIQIPGLNLEQKQSLGFEQLSGVFAYIAAFFLLVVLAPIFEELLFRGYLFGAIRARSGFWVSAILTSLTFALMHGQLNVGIDVFILSLFLCYLREKSESIWPGILVHALKNGMAYTLLFIVPLYGIHLF